MTTMQDSRDQIERLAKELIKAYFIEHDYEKMMSFISERINWIGTGRIEIGRDRESLLNILKREQQIYPETWIISDEQYHIEQFSPDTAGGIVTLTVQSDLADGAAFRKQVRFSSVLRRERDGWKVVQFHNSVPFEDPTGEDGFSVDNVRQDYQVIENSLRQMLEQQRRELQERDGLTGLLNRSGFERNCREVLAVPKEKRHALLAFGVNHFRYINQLHGFDVGDNILRSIAQNIQDACVDGELCARLEKDHFAMLLFYETPQDLFRRIEEIRDCLLDDAIQQQLRIHITFAAGVYPIPDNPDQGVRQMLDKALIALQSAPREEGTSQYAFYNEALEKQLFRKNDLMERASDAMKNGEFQLYIQPQVDLKTGRITAGEALVRWVTKHKEIIGPNEFIPLFEENKFIRDLDFYLLEQLCKEMNGWAKKGLPAVEISSNQSRLHLSEVHYVEKFFAVLDKWEVPYRQIVVELTESAFVENDTEMYALSRCLHERGVRLAIDDFGTGYASLNVLSMLSADILKLDRSLLQDFDTNARSRIVLKKVVEMARETEMQTVCEGIETEAQLDYVKSIGCDIGQGFLFSKPIPVREFENLLRRQELGETDCWKTGS